MKTVINEKDFGLHDCADYLIQLFYKTNKKYTCNRPKIGKLLSILALKYARVNRKVFLDGIYKYPGCGTYIPELTAYCGRDVYQNLEYKDNNKVIPLDEFDNLISAIIDYNTCIPIDVIKGILAVFYNFGAYSQKRLGDCLNPIVEYKDVCEDDGSINFNKIAELKINDLYKIGSNEVIDYIFFC